MLRDGIHRTAALTMAKRKTPSTNLFVPTKAPSHRQQRVAEEIRHILAEIMTRGDLSRGPLIHPVTITGIKAAPDLRRATIYVMPLGGLKSDEVLQQLNEEAWFFRHELGRAIRLKYVPEITFELDTLFEYAEKIDRLLK